MVTVDKMLVLEPSDALGNFRRNPMRRFYAALRAQFNAKTLAGAGRRPPPLHSPVRYSRFLLTSGGR